MPTAPAQTKTTLVAALLRVGVFALIAYIGLWIFPPLMLAIGGYFVAAALGTFAAAAAANAIAVRIWERGRLADVGLAWTDSSGRNVLLGFAGGAGSAIVVLALPLAFRLASFERVPDQSLHWPSLMFVSLVLLFGAVGEEMLFRGYPFRVLIRALGPFATILPASVLFALAHLRNQNVSWLGLVNTLGWGVIFGYAVVRIRDLWLAIGLHFGWNWVVPLFGVNLSGFTMGVTGYTMRWKTGVLWSGGDYGPEASLLTCGVIVLLFLYLRRAPVVPASGLEPGPEV